LTEHVWEGGFDDGKSDRQTQALVACEVTSFRKYNKRADMVCWKMIKRKKNLETINKKVSLSINFAKLLFNIL
jgi:hypothetical protein